MQSRTIFFVVGVVLGIYAGENFSSASELALFGVGLIFIQLLCIVIFTRKNIREKIGRSSLPLSILLISLGIVIGIVRVEFMEDKKAFTCESSCTIQGTIVATPTIKDTYQTFALETKSIDENYLYVQVRAPLYPSYHVGETINISGKIRAPEIIPPHGTQNQFDYASYLLTRNIGSEIFFPKIEVIDEDTHTLSGKLGRIKEGMTRQMNVYVSAPASALANGMLFGASSLSKELSQTFRVAGLSHIIVLSGFNIAILIAAVIFILAFVPLFIRVLLASVFVILFVMMVGAEASVIRATLMAFIALLAMMSGREYAAGQALILSLFLIIMYDPYALFHDVSLHLSFLATAGIVYISEPIKKILERFVHGSFLEILTTTLAAYIATLPYIMHTFGSASLYALVTNAIVLPFVPIAMFVSFLTVIFSYISHYGALIFGFIDSLLINVMIGAARIIEHLPFSLITISISLQGMLVVYGVIILAAIFRYRKRVDETPTTNEHGILSGIVSY